MGKVMGRMRRLRWGLVGGVVLTLAVARPLLGADLSGTWRITYWVDQENRETVTLEITHERGLLPGTGSIRGAGESQMSRVEIRSGVVTGHDFRFTLVEPGGVAARPTVLVGSWYRDEMSGQAEGTFGKRMFGGSRLIRY